MEKETKVKSKEQENKKEVKEVKNVKETKKVENKKVDTKQETKTTNKKDKKQDKNKENVAKESKKEVKKDKKDKKTEVISETKTKNKENSLYNKKRLIYVLVGVLLILVAVLLYTTLIHGNTPKGTVNNYFKVLKENPQLAVRKYGESEFEKKLQNERLKYLQYKVLSERKTNKKSESNVNSTVYEVEIEIKNTSARTVYEKTKKQMKNFKFREGTKEYKKEFIKQYTKINKEESKHMQSIKNKIYVVKDTLSSKYILVDDVEK